MAIENHPVWPFEPNWTSPVGETLAWVTDILQSPRGTEQRRSLRYFPRRTLDFSISMEGAERSFFDNLMMSHAHDDWYLPIWFDLTLTTAMSTVTSLPCNPSHNIVAGTVIFIGGSSAFDFQIAEVSAVTPSVINLTDPLARAVPAGARIFPMTIGRLVEMPAITALTDGLETAEPQFLITEKPNDSDQDNQSELISRAGLVDEYRQFYVLTRASDWSDSHERGQQRLLDEMENPTGLPVRVDTAKRPFPSQQHHWALDGVGDHRSFYALMQVLRGRAIPVWLPTWMDDMRMDEPSLATESVIRVKRFGYTEAGGPRPEREDIMIELVSGERIYRRITNSAITGSGETILLDAPLGVDLLPIDVLRICFMSLMRLDHDSIEIEHLTDTEGAAEVKLTFRAAPNSRVAEPAFEDA